MKNKLPEFFKLFDLEPGDRFGISNYSGAPWRLTDDYRICNCDGHEVHIDCLCDVLCGDEILTKLPKTTEKEDRILHALYDLGWNWIARDKYGDLRVYHETPCKHDKYWTGGGYHPIPSPLYDKETDFQFVQWEDEEPFDIEKYVKEQGE